LTDDVFSNGVRLDDGECAFYSHDEIPLFYYEKSRLF